MRSGYKRWITGFMCLGLAGTVYTQKEISRDDFFVGRMLTADDGLPGRQPTVMAEDQYGFIWIGGEEGLARYDGNEFRLFKRTEGPEPSLIDNHVRCLLAQGNKLWIGTFDGLCVLDLVTEKFTHYPFRDIVSEFLPNQPQNFQINRLYMDPEGHIWIGTALNGIARYQPETNDFRFFHIRQKDIPETHTHPLRVHAVLDFCTDSTDADIMWVGLYGGLLRFDRSTEQYQLYYFPRDDKEQQMIYNSFRRLLYHPNGKIYCGSWHNVLQVFDPKTGRMEDITVAPTGSGLNPEVMNVRSLNLSRDGLIWISSTSGLLTLDPTDYTLKMIWPNDELNSHIYGIDFIDRVNRLYCFTDQGLIVFDPREQKFQPHSFAHLSTVGSGLAFSVSYEERSKGYLISVGNATGLYHFNPVDLTWRAIPIPSHLMPGEKAYWIRNLTKLEGDTYVLATGKRLLLFDALTETFNAIPIQLPLAIPRIHNVFCDSKKNIWIATSNDGVWRWETGTNSIRQFTLSDDPEFGAGDEETFFEDHQGQIWIKCRNAFAIYAPPLDTLMHFVPENLITPFHTTFAEDRGHHVWIASTNGWIGRIDLQQAGYIAERHQLGSIDNSLMTFQMDDQGVLWCALKDNLVRFDTETKSMISYPYSRELKSRPLFFMKYMPDGNLVFTSRDHIVLFNRLAADKPGQPALPYITGIEIREEPLLTDTTFHHLKVLHLQPQENFFSISFSALGLSLGDNQVFRYRLRDFQDEWIEAENRRYANFTNVPSGHYTFELELRDLLGKQEAATFKLPVIIRKKITEMWWFRLSGLFLILGFFHSVYRYRIQQIRNEEKLKTEFERQLALAETQALRAQMNPHFIFNSLNSIENYILKNDTEKAAMYLNDFSRLIRLILENSRATLIPLRTELETLQLYLEMEGLRFKDKLNSRIHVDPVLNPDDIMIPPMLIQPFVENAIWHGIMPKAGTGNVSIHITPHDNTLQIMVEDDGIGRQRSAEINSRKNKGGKKSLGMGITRERIELYKRLYEKDTALHITDLTDASGQAAGTRVEIVIPV